MKELETNIMGDPETAFGNMDGELNACRAALDMKALCESLRVLGEETKSSVKAVFEYADGATLTISYQSAKGWGI